MRPSWVAADGERVPLGRSPSPAFGGGAAETWGDNDPAAQQPAKTDGWFPASIGNIINRCGRHVHLVIRPDHAYVVNSGPRSIRSARLAELWHSTALQTGLTRLSDLMVWHYGQMQPTTRDDASTSSPASPSR